jgi:hypothetical protein
MNSAHDNAACAAKRGWARMGLPPFVASPRRVLSSVMLVGCTVLGAACSSSSAAGPATAKSTALPIPPPFEVGQQVGLGDVSIVVDSFSRTGDAVTVHVGVANAGSHALTVTPATAFAVFYGSGLHAPTTATGISRPIAPNAHESATLEFQVPTAFGFPLVWFRGSVPGTHAGAVVLRGNHS